MDGWIKAIRERISYNVSKTTIFLKDRFLLHLTSMDVFCLLMIMTIMMINIYFNKSHSQAIQLILYCQSNT